MVGFTKTVFNFSIFKPTLKWNRFLADLSRGTNSLNSDTDVIVNWAGSKIKNFAVAENHKPGGTEQRTVNNF